MQYLAYEKEMDPWHLHIAEIFSGLCINSTAPKEPDCFTMQILDV